MPPNAKAVIKMGIIRISRPASFSSSQPMPASIAPVLVTTSRKPPMISTKKATSMAASEAEPSSDGSYMPAIGAMNTSITPCGLGSTSW